MSIDDYRSFFLRYVETFSSPDADTRFNLSLKKEHSFRVCEEIKGIGSALGLSWDDLRIAEISALFHDIGRFEQYTRFKTFVDRASIDHAELGLGVLRDTGVLLSLPPEERELICRAIGFHNRAAIPGGLPERSLLFCKLLRDADKLDILHILTTRYHQEKNPARSAVELELPGTPGVSPDAFADLMAGRIVHFSHVHTRDDFKILQMAWIFDINFAFSFQKIDEKNYLESLRDALPDSDMTRKAYRFARENLDKRLADNAYTAIKSA